MQVKNSDLTEAFFIKEIEDREENISVDLKYVLYIYIYILYIYIIYILMN